MSANRPEFIVVLPVFCILFLSLPAAACGQSTNAEGTRITAPIGEGWAKTSVNAVIFRQNSVVSQGDNQYTAFYDPEGAVVLARRRQGADTWVTRVTPYRGKVEDAHNAISIAIDGSGVLHMAWNHHGNSLNYVRGSRPGGLDLSSPLAMTGKAESNVTYPQFYRLTNGDLLFAYRDGRSGNGNVMLNRYDVNNKRWDAVAHPLIDGEGERNAYVNTVAVGPDGTWHVSWTWRETWDVSTNHDLLYARSPDRGTSWVRSDGSRYNLPITADNAETIRPIPQGSELINQTTMTVNSEGEPVIASYWRPAEGEAPQYHILWRDGVRWNTRQVTHRGSSFSLSGGGTKRIPISRPLIVAGDRGELYLVYRDFERGGGISVATSSDAAYRDWDTRTIYTDPVGMWEPTYDPAAWENRRELHLFVQGVGQGDGEGLEDLDPQEVFILEWTPGMYRNK